MRVLYIQLHNLSSANCRGFTLACFWSYKSVTAVEMLYFCILTHYTYCRSLPFFSKWLLNNVFSLTLPLGLCPLQQFNNSSRNFPLTLLLSAVKYTFKQLVFWHTFFPVSLLFALIVAYGLDITHELHLDLIYLSKSSDLRCMCL